MKRKYGFTLIELLVVMVIIAVLAGLLLPAVRKSRSKALLDKANAEMAALSSVITMAKLDCGFYVRLCDLAAIDTSTIKVLDTSIAPAVWETPDPLPGDPFYVVHWDGPYQVFQSKGVLGLTTGSIPTDNTGTWDITAPTDHFPDGAPLDPWGRAYGLSYSVTDKVMIVYSAGPNGRMETSDGAVVVGDGSNPPDGDTLDAADDPDSDDIVYKFR